MRDAFPIIGKEITYNKKVWTIKQFFYVPGNPEIYVGLSDGNVMMNVRLTDIKQHIFKEGVGVDSVPGSVHIY